MRRFLSPAGRLLPLQVAVCLKPLAVAILRAVIPQEADFLVESRLVEAPQEAAEVLEGVLAEAVPEEMLVVAVVAMPEGVVYPKFLVALLVAARVADCPRSLAALLATKVAQRLETK